MSEFAYVGVKTCGCAVVMVADREEWKKDTAKSVAQMVKDGYSVERWPMERARVECRRCIHLPKDAA